MSKTYLKPGDRMTYANASGATIASGTPVLVGAVFGIACTDIADGESGELAVVGVHTLTKSTGTSTGGAQGAVAYWDATAKKITAVATDNTAIGKFWAACTDNATTCVVKLNV